MNGTRLAINPNTVLKAYRGLEREGLVRARPGQGTFITRSLPATEYVAVTGPSGSGKSTLLHLLGLLDTPTEGSYLLDGLDTSALNDRDRAALRGRRIGVVFQAFHLLPYRTALENVLNTMVHFRPRPMHPADQRYLDAVRDHIAASWVGPDRVRAPRDSPVITVRNGSSCLLAGIQGTLTSAGAVTVSVPASG